MDINFLLSFKENITLQKLDTKLDIKENTEITFNRFYKNYPIKKPNNKIKDLCNHETISNKVNLILNKLSEINFDKIILEFLEIINQISITEYEEFQKTIYIKILSEINFITIYLKFLELINNLYFKVQNYTLEFLVTSIELKFKLDYIDNFIIDDNKYLYINNITDDSNRINNLILIKSLINFNLLSNELITDCENILFNQIKYLSDIYYWKPNMTNNNINKLKSIIDNNTLSIRDKTLLENLLSNTFSIDDIINNYLENLNLTNVINYINSSCPDSITKIKFSKNVLETHIAKNNLLESNNNKLLNLLKLLINNNNIFKIDVINSFKLINNIDENIISYFE